MLSVICATEAFCSDIVDISLCRSVVAIGSLSSVLKIVKITLISSAELHGRQLCIAVVMLSTS
ncbi:hypothetical protein D9M71_403970 [compost metagenome]